MPSLHHLESSHGHRLTASLLIPSSACPPLSFVKQDDQSRCAHTQVAERHAAGFTALAYVSKPFLSHARSLSKAKVRLAQAAMANRDTSVTELCRELGIKPVTLYRYVGPQGQLRAQGAKVLAG